MLAKHPCSLLLSAVRWPSRRCFCNGSFLLREHTLGSTGTVDYEIKYADKLRQRAEEQGKSVPDLLSEIKEREKERRRQRLVLEAQKNAPSARSPSGSSPSPSSSTTSPRPAVRRDSSPVKPLNSIFNLERLLSTPPTPEQLSVLWRAYHSSRSGGTGRGFLSASVPVDTYEKMLNVAMRYPTFVVPIPRPKVEGIQPEDKPAYEFYFMEWGFHGAPPEPSTVTNPFSSPKASSNPQIATLMFTPLQEYKLRNSFATPYLVMTHYTDLARSHGQVLLRGEITPSTSTPVGGSGEGDGRFMLSQQDAQLLAIAVQRFYLWSEGENERTALLQAFHDKPADFNWEVLLKHVDYSL